MEKKAIETGNPITVNGVTLIPLNIRLVKGWQGKHGFFAFGTKQPYSLIAVSPSVKKAFRTTGEAVPLDELIAENPSLKELLDDF